MNREDKLQIEVAAWLDANLHEDVIWYHVPNETKAKPQYHAKRKRMGVKSGVPDVVIHWTENEHRNGIQTGFVLNAVVYIELKAPTTYKRSEKTGKRIIDSRGGTQSDAQISFMDKCNLNGMAYYVRDSLEGVKEVLEQHKQALK